MSFCVAQQMLDIIWSMEDTDTTIQQISNFFDTFRSKHCELHEALINNEYNVLSFIHKCTLEAEISTENMLLMLSEDHPQLYHCLSGDKILHFYKICRTTHSNTDLKELTVENDHLRSQIEVEHNTYEDLNGLVRQKDLTIRELRIQLQKIRSKSVMLENEQSQRHASEGRQKALAFTPYVEDDDPFQCVFHFSLIFFISLFVISSFLHCFVFIF